MRKFFVGIVALLLLFNQATVVFATAKADIADFKGKRTSLYDTKEHPKASGLRLTMPYPKSWVTEEGRHPHIVQKIKTDDGKHVIGTAIEVHQSPMNRGYTAAEINNEKFRKDLAKRLSATNTYIDSGDTQIDGENAVWVFSLQQAATPTVKVKLLLLTYSVIFAGKEIMITHMVSGEADDPKLKEVFDAYTPIFQAMTIGVIFPDKWSR